MGSHGRRSGRVVLWREGKRKHNTEYHKTKTKNHKGIVTAWWPGTQPCHEGKSKQKSKYSIWLKASG